MPRLVAVRQRIERRPGRRLGIERLGKLAGNTDLAGSRVHLDVDVDLVAALHPRAGPVLRADADHWRAVDGRDAGAVGEAVDRHADFRPPARAERLDDVLRHAEPGRRLAALEDRGMEPHGSPSGDLVEAARLDLEHETVDRDAPDPGMRPEPLDLRAH